MRVMTYYYISTSEILLGIYCRIEYQHFRSVPVYAADKFDITAKCCIVFQFLIRVYI